jgi:hypothetical protein
MDTVAAIGRDKGDGSIGWMASGFLYGQFESKEGEISTYQIYLVTNRHVLDGQQSIVVRFGSDGTALAPTIVIRVVDGSGSPTYVLHPDPEIDVAVLPMNVALLQIPGTKFSFFQSDSHTMSRSEALEAELTEGDGAFVLGFPMGQVGGDRNYVIVRHGAIARIRDWLAGASKEFLVDATVFPGNSGGPVVTRPTSTSIQGTKRVAAAHLIGIVKGYVPYSDVAVSAQTGRTRVTFEENSGLSAVVPFDYIEEAVRFHLASKTAAPSVQATQTPDSEGPAIEPSQARDMTSPSATKSVRPANAGSHGKDSLSKTVSKSARRRRV